MSQLQVEYSRETIGPIHISSLDVERRVVSSSSPIKRLDIHKTLTNRRHKLRTTLYCQSFTSSPLGYIVISFSRLNRKFLESFRPTNEIITIWSQSLHSKDPWAGEGYHLTAESFPSSPLMAQLNIHNTSKTMNWWLSVTRNLSVYYNKTIIH